MKDRKTKIDEYFKKIDKLGWDLNLRSIFELLKYVGNPQNQIAVVHAAGTNGKGSTLAFLSSIMEETGLQVGRFTSPALVDRNEMITINGVKISDAEMERGISMVEEACQKMVDSGFRHPTSFEVMAVLAFLYFKGQVDLALIETGMGGRLDATNVVAEAKLCIITPIGMDHEAFLGDCLEKIAMEKAGVFRPKVPVVSAPQEKQVEATLREKAQLIEAPFILIDRSNLSVLEEGTSLRFIYRSVEYKTEILGRHQAVNAAVAIESAKRLDKMGWSVTDEDLLQGISKAHWPGRFEILRRDPLVVIDGAHNAQGMQALNHARKQILKGEYRVVVGILGEKDMGPDFLEILGEASEVWTATPNNPRALSASNLSTRLLKQGIKSEAVEDFEVLIDLLASESTLSGSFPCLIFGSLYLIGPLGNALKRRLKNDSCFNCG
ncbi:folylpolyglutamate synthase/dihydrofolate synthase family protein [Gottschalkiaceae bacterium SANA]|nr:folylpolyglutamate synthase/dihydrofolate synthase family protein [Gottschalkiaceae bacterium SANA]